MPAPRRPLRIAAIAVALSLLVGGLTLAESPEPASAASMTSDAATVLKKINNKRAAHKLEKFATNSALSSYAQSWADSMSTGGGGLSEELYPLPVDAVTGDAPEYLVETDWVYHFGTPSKSRVRVISSGLTSGPYRTLWKQRGFSHAAVGLVTRRSTTYFVLIVADYPECAPGKITSGKPSIAGSGKVGEVLTARPGQWSSSRSLRFRYEWKADGVLVGEGRYYTPGRGDVNKRVSVTVEGSRECYVTPSARTSASKVVRASALPVVTGERNVGSTLTADPGTWFRAGSTLTYTWRNSHGSSPSQASPHLVIEPSELGQRISVSVTATAPGYSATKSTTTTLTVRGPLLSSRPVPTMTGTAVAFGTLIAEPGDWGSGVTLTYVWRVDGATVPFASGAEFVIPSNAVGKKITVSVTGERDGFATATQTSEPSLKVAPLTFADGDVTVVGTPKVGSYIDVKTNWPFAAQHCQWYRNGRVVGEPMDEVPSCRLEVTKKMRGSKLTVRVTAKAPGFAPKSETTAPVTAY